MTDTTIQTPDYMIANYFQDGQNDGDIVEKRFRDLVASLFAVAGDIPQFNSLADALVWSATATAGAPVLVNGYASPFDGGEFPGVVEAASDPNNPDGGNIKPYGRAVDVRMWGARGDGTTDDAAAIQAAIDWMSTTGGGRVDVPQPDAYFRTLSCIHMRPNVHLIGIGKRPEIRNEQTVAGWDVVPLSCGTYYARSGIGDAFNEPTFDIDDVVKPADVITSAAAVAGGLQVGDIIALNQLTITTSIYYDYAEVNEVVAIDGNDISLRFPVLFSYGTDGGASKLRILGRYGSASTAASGIDGDGAYILTDAVVENLALTQANPSVGYKSLHIAAHDCLFRDLSLSGFSAFTGNPVSSCRFESIEFDFTQLGIELAYLSCRSVIAGAVGRRAGVHNPANTFLFSLMVGSEDGGGENQVLNSRFTDLATTASNQSQVVLFAPYSLARNVAYRSGGGTGTGGFYIGEDCVGDGLFVAGAKTAGIRLAGNNPRIFNSQVGSVPSGAYGVLLQTSAANALVSGVVVGVPGAHTADDVIHDNNPTGNNVILASRANGVTP